jgi:CheY-like chemotaxis protein
MKLQLDALYIKLSKQIKDISAIFKKILWSIYITDIESFSPPPQKLEYNLIIIDFRGEVRGVERVLKILSQFRSIYSLVIFDKNGKDQLYKFIEVGVDFFLPYPSNKSELKFYIHNFIQRVSLENRLKECQNKLNYCNEEVSSEKLENIDCIELQKHLQIVESYLKKTCRESNLHLQNILNMNRLLIQSDLNEREITFLGSALQSINQLQNRFEELEQFIIPEEKFLNSNKIPFNINAILENISVIMSKHWKYDGLNLIFDISNNVPAKILGNPILLSKVLVALLELIVKVKEEGEIILSVDVRKRGEKEFLHFDPAKSIQKNSNEEHKLKKIIFKPQFLRTKSLVEMMGGEFRSKDGEIIGIDFIIPLIRLDRRNYRLPSKKWMNKSVLIIEKNRFVANALEGMLKYFHYEVQKSDNIKDAENKLYHKTFDLIFLAEELFDSFEIYGYPLKRDAKVVVMAWPGTQKSRISDYLAKSDTVIIKPFTQQKVFDTILELYSNDILKEQKETLAIMRENLSFLLKGKRAVYIGDDDSNWLMIKSLLKGSLSGMLRAHSLKDVTPKVGNSDLIILGPKVYSNREWRSWLVKCPKLCREKNVIALVDNLDSKLIKAIKRLGVSQYLLIPINPDNFYRILMEELMG